MAYPFLSDLIRDLTGLDLPLPIPTFGLLVAAALLVTVRLTHSELHRMHVAGQIPPARRHAKSNGSVEEHLPVPAYELTSGLALVMVFAGLIGARVFHLLEYWDQFINNPMRMIFTRSGFTAFGGLIAGLLAGAIYARRHRIALPELGDALAPALMMGYAIGRVGCQISGDGDWGVVADVSLKPTWIPMWLWAQTYDGNIAGVLIQPPGVYPTPIYETAMGLIAFGILWSLREHRWRAGWLFCVFLLLTGVERLIIEQIRVNTMLDLFGLRITQAELISLAFVVVGIVGIVVLRKPRGTTSERSLGAPL
jgi:phosphatidylglycerol---prolipoprotein diacylglyceryl transferase